MNALQKHNIIYIFELAKQGNKTAYNFFSWYGINIIDEKGEWETPEIIIKQLDEKEKQFIN